MLKKRYIITALGVVGILLGSLLYINIILAQSGGEYDPWTDLNDDGTVDAYDLQALAFIYGTLGKPINKTAVLVPVGGMIPWAKNLPSIPPLPENFVECNGQTLDDPESPLHGQIIPNLNGFGGETQRFLRGSTTSGATGGSETHSHMGTTDGVAGWLGANHAQAGSQGINHVHNFETAESSNMPSYYEVVWIMRVK